MNQPLRVLHLFANYKWTGPADPAIRTVARLRDLGLDVVFAEAGFVHAGGEHRMREELWRQHLPVVTGLELRKHFHLPSLLRDVRALRALCRRDRYDLLHCHQTADHLLAALACRRLVRPPVLVRTLYEPELPAPGVRQRWCFRRTAGAVVPTRAVEAALRRRGGLPAGRVLLQEPVIEPRRCDGPDLRARLGLLPHQLVVGITARIQPHRRFDLLWQVARAVVTAQPDARFVLLGRGNEQDTERLVRAPIARLGLGAQVVLPGYLREPDYSAALRALDVFLFLVPGSDGTCRAVREAMAFGLPVVATPRGILPELLAARAGGLAPGVVAAETPLALAHELLLLLGDRRLRKQRGSAALARARIDMDPAAGAQRLLAFYRTLLPASAVEGR